MRVLITGGSGQLGRDLQLAITDHELRALSHRDLDITDEGVVNEAIASFAPQVVVHTAALTDTARCEQDPEAAYGVNAIGARHVATACAAAGAAMVYVSTNEVFDGTKREPYLESDEPQAINAYGRSKLEGERMVATVLPAHYIVRTAWLYGEGGNHFVTKLLRAAEAGQAAGVTDEIATPTWTRDLAIAISRLIETQRYGTYHLTNAGEASRYRWAEEALRLAGKADVPLRAMTTKEFRASLQPGVVAPRKPPYSLLANTAGAALGIELRPWEEALREYFEAGL